MRFIISFGSVNASSCYGVRVEWLQCGWSHVPQFRFSTIKCAQSVLMFELRENKFHEKKKNVENCTKRMHIHSQMYGNLGDRFHFVDRTSGKRTTYTRYEHFSSSLFVRLWIAIFLRHSFWASDDQCKDYFFVWSKRSSSFHIKSITYELNGIRCTLVHKFQLEILYILFFAFFFSSFRSQSRHTRFMRW